MHIKSFFVIFLVAFCFTQVSFAAAKAQSVGVIVEYWLSQSGMTSNIDGNSLTDQPTIITLNESSKLTVKLVSGTTGSTDIGSQFFNVLPSSSQSTYQCIYVPIGSKAQCTTYIHNSNANFTSPCKSLGITINGQEAYSGIAIYNLTPENC